MKAKKLVPLLLIGLFLVTLELYLLRYSDFVGNIFYLMSPFLAVCFGIYAFLTYRISNAHGQALGLIGLGLLFFFVGDFIFFWYQFVSHTNPYPSMADVFYLTAYPLLFAGFIREATVHKVNWRNFNKLVLILIILILLFLAIIVSYFGVYLAYTAGDSKLSNFISIAYGVGDLILIVPSLFILKIALDYRGGKLFYSWALMLLGLMSMLTGDILFAIFKNSYTALVWPYTLIDIAYVASYLLFAYSFYYTGRVIKDLHQKMIKPAADKS